MKHTLSHFEELIETHVFSAGLVHPSAAEHEIFRIRLQKLHKELDTNMVDALSGITEEAIAHRLVKFVQWKLVKIADDIYAQLKLHRAANHELALHASCALLDSLQELYGEYFFLDGKVPEYFLEQAAKEFNSSYQLQFRKLKKRSEKSKLPEVFRDYFQSFQKKNGETFSYRDLIYARKLLIGLEKLVNREKSADYDTRLFELAIYFNFNKKNVLDCCKEHFSRELDHTISLSTIRSNNLYYLKEIREMQEILDWSYNREHMSLKLFVINILEEELSWLKHYEQELSGELTLNNKSFFIMDITVKQMILWAELNVDLKRIPYHSVPQVLKVLTSFLRTLHPSPIHYDSARKKISEIDAPTAKGLHKLLSSQLELLENKYSHFM